MQTLPAWSFSVPAARRHVLVVFLQDGDAMGIGEAHGTRHFRIAAFPFRYHAHRHSRLQPLRIVGIRSFRGFGFGVPRDGQRLARIHLR